MSESSPPRPPLRLLMLGHVTAHPSGSTLLFQKMVQMCQANPAISLKVINTARPTELTRNWVVNFFAVIRVTFSLLLDIRWAQVVSLHASRPAMTLYGPFLYLICRVFNKPLVLRLFGGAFEKHFEAFPAVVKWVLKNTIFASELFVVETKLLLDYFTPYASGLIKQLPNFTKLADLPLGMTTRRNNGRYVFLGIVKEEKGVDVILNAVHSLLPGISLDIYGPLWDNYTAESINARGKGAISYKGVISPEDVYKKLYDYDVLVLPSFYPGEGYPAVIIEAYSHCIPVISTEWRSIPEIVGDDTGMLIPIQSHKALSNAMNVLFSDSALYSRLICGVMGKRELFSDEYWAHQFCSWCVELTARFVSETHQMPD